MLLRIARRCSKAQARLLKRSRGIGRRTADSVSFCSRRPLGLSVSSFATSSAPREDPGPVYDSAFGNSLRYLKVFSISSCLFTATCGPVLVFGPELLGEAMSTYPLIVRASIGGTCIVTSFGCTTLLNFMFKPYVTRAERDPDSGMLNVSTISLFGRQKVNKIDPDNIVVESPHPLSTFVDSATGRSYFVHTDAKEGDNADALRELMPMLAGMLQPVSEGSGGNADEGDGTP